MAKGTTHGNQVRHFRRGLGLTQAELARRAGVSRTAVTAIEQEQLTPSVATALALASALETTVERLFGGDAANHDPGAWAWPPTAGTNTCWEAEVNGQRWLYPAESAPMITPVPDSVNPDEPHPAAGSLARQTLSLACCDPAAGLLAGEYGRATGQRLLVWQRSSRQALELLKQGKVHVAGLHFSSEDEPDQNARIVRELLGDECQLLHVVTWQEGIATAAGLRVRSVQSALRSRLTWIGREPGSGARQCLDRLLGNRRAPERLARNHRGVAEAISSGWAEAGVCLQLTSAEAGLGFLPVQREAYDLCIPNSLWDDFRVQGLLKVIRSVSYRRMLSQLPGYDTTDTGALSGVCE